MSLSWSLWLANPKVFPSPHLHDGPFLTQSIVTRSLNPVFSGIVLSASVEEAQGEGGATTSAEKTVNGPHKYYKTECLPVPGTWPLFSWALPATVTARMNILLSETRKQMNNKEDKPTMQYSAMQQYQS